MQTNHFYCLNEENVHLIPDSKRIWSNYLGSENYASVILNNGKGFSYSGSTGLGAFIKTHQEDEELTGKCIYIRDCETNDFWSNTRSPVCKPLEQIKNRCEHHSGYTIIDTEYDEIQSKTCYLIPRNKNFEIVHLQLINKSM